MDEFKPELPGLSPQRSAEIKDALLRAIDDEDAEYIRLYPEPRVNELPALTFECGPGHDRHLECRGETYWQAKCQCACHLPATSRRAQVQ